MKTITINDIAEKLEMSRNTVSKVLNGKTGVESETRKRIIKTAYNMGYSKLNSNLLSEIDVTPLPVERKQGNIIVLTNKNDINTFWSTIISGIYSCLSGSHFSLVYCQVSDTDEDCDEILNIIKKYHVDGLIVINIYNKPLLNTISTLGVPCVYYDCPVGADVNDLNGDIVLVEGIVSIKEITHDLLNKGCDDVIFIGDVTYSRTVFDRWLGFCVAFDERQLTHDRNRSFLSDEYRFYRKESIDRVMKSMDKIPSAIVCANDLIARSVIVWLTDHGYSVPGQIRVSGFDDSAECTIMSPQITSVKTYNEMMGARLAKQVLSRMNSVEEMYETIIMCAKVKYRESTK